MQTKSREEVFEEYLKHPRKFFAGAIMRFGAHADDVDDILQNALMYGWKHFDSWRGSCKFDTWMWFALRHQAYMFYRKNEAHERIKAKAATVIETDIVETDASLGRAIELVQLIKDECGDSIASIMLARAAGFTMKEMWPQFTLAKSKALLVRTRKIIKRVLNNDVLSQSERKRIRLSFLGAEAGGCWIRCVRQGTRGPNEGVNETGGDGPENSVTTIVCGPSPVEVGSSVSGDNSDRRRDRHGLQGGDIGDAPQLREQELPCAAG